MTVLNGLSLVAIVSLLAVSSCARGTEAEPKVGGDQVSEAEPEAVEQTGDEYAGVSTEPEVNACFGKPCSINAECCDGYSCGFDPDRSRVQRYCLSE